VRATSLLNKLLGINKTRVVGFAFVTEGLVLDVRPTTQVPICGGCMLAVGQIYDSRERRWRHLDFGEMKVHLRTQLRRVRCPRCGITTELVPWAQPQSWFTHAFEQTAAYLAQSAAKTVVAEMMRIAWSTVGAIVTRFVARHRGDDPLAGLTHIGIDELSYRRHHEYVTVVVDHIKARIVWAAPGKNADTLRSFFSELGAERCGELEAITIDMSAAYITAVTEAAPKAKLVFDRFHVQRLAHDALDQVRRNEVRDIDAPEDRRALKNTRFALQKNPWNLTAIETGRLADVQRTNAPIYRAYLLKESLAEILDRRQPNVAGRLLDKWTDWAAHSKLAPFAKVAGTIRKYRDGILAYVATGLSNGRTEGINGKARTITRRSYGLHGPRSLIAMLFLCCSGLKLRPAHSTPSFH
jgi:transposase